MVTVGENKCPKCGGRIDTYRQDDPMSFNGTIIFKHVCSSCGYVLGSNESSDKSTGNTTVSNTSDKCPVCSNWLFLDAETGEKRCTTCGYSEANIPSLLKTGTNSLVNEPENKPCGLMGWICPKCGRGLSPFTDYCPCSVNWEITCDTNSASHLKIEDIGNCESSDVSELSQYLGYSRKDKLGYE
jgi:hypothetical protein